MGIWSEFWLLKNRLGSDVEGADWPQDSPSTPRRYPERRSALHEAVCGFLGIKPVTDIALATVEGGDAA